MRPRACRAQNTPNFEQKRYIKFKVLSIFEFETPFVSFFIILNKGILIILRDLTKKNLIKIIKKLLTKIRYVSLNIFLLDVRLKVGG